ncbi:helix-turn-helix domain-containing protein [Streptomyces sp. NPDC047097]|uniref:helix-turn-helix domain-containing protein n=1 Tax=Streptomyces sp. NPDC047097 TaxID=3155260 RepID=UPI0033D9C0C2
MRTRHTERFTVVGNHLAQHRQLSLVAIGLAVHIQSLPDGAKVGIKVLAERFPESEHRIAAALRELEEHRYLTRVRERLADGKVVTRTVSYDRPGVESGTTEGGVGRSGGAGRSCPPPGAEAVPVPAPAPAPASEGEKGAGVGASGARRVVLPLPEPEGADPERYRLAVGLLAGLRREDARLVLGEGEVRRLAPAVVAWLEREVGADGVRDALTADLPPVLRRPVGLLAHRLSTRLPPPLPAAPPGPEPPEPLVFCGGTCDRMIRSAVPDALCRDCREAASLAETAA